jgi:DNA polymerase III epsilon subunit-like protein
MFLIFDIETTGLIKCKKFNAYPNFKNNNEYDNARIVQIAWILLDKKYNTIDKKSYIVKRDGFNIPNPSFHGINNAISDIKGTKFEIIMMDFAEALNRTEMIIAHNILFDYNVLVNHMYRYDLQYLHSVFITKERFCTSQKSASLLKLSMPYYSRYFKYPSLQELYSYYFKKKIIGAHNAEVDVDATTKCFVLLYQDLANRVL